MYIDEHDVECPLLSFTLSGQLLIFALYTTIHRSKQNKWNVYVCVYCIFGPKDTFAYIPILKKKFLRAHSCVYNTGIIAIIFIHHQYNF